MRFISARRYTVETTTFEECGSIRSLCWYAPDGELDAPAGFPALVIFYQTGRIRQMAWYSDGKLHRDHDMPANVFFNDSDREQIIHAIWYQHGQEHRDGDMPSSIHIEPETERICGLGFKRHGIGREEEGLPGELWIECDGTLVNGDEESIEVDLSHFAGNLPRPPPIGRPPFLGLG